MFSKAKKTERIDVEQREQFEYARRRIKQKKNLMRHFTLFLVGSVLLIILDEFMEFGHEILFKGWYIWAVLIWAFIFLVHLFNVFVMNKFMDKEWEDRQMEKLKARQAERIAELQKEVDTELQLPTMKEVSPNKTDLNNPLPPDVQ